MYIYSKSYWITVLPEFGKMILNPICTESVKVALLGDLHELKPIIHTLV